MITMMIIKNHQAGGINNLHKGETNMLLLDSTDITKIKCDVIVNSLGVDTTVYGRLCENIIKAANSEE